MCVTASSHNAIVDVKRARVPGTRRLEPDHRTRSNGRVGGPERGRQEHDSRFAVALLRSGSRTGTIDPVLLAGPSLRPTFVSTHASFSDLPGLDQFDQPKCALAPGSNRRRVARADPLRGVDCRQHPVRTGRHQGRGADGGRRPSECPRFHQTATERNITVNVKPNGKFRGKTKDCLKISTNRQSPAKSV